MKRLISLIIVLILISQVLIVYHDGLNGKNQNIKDNLVIINKKFLNSAVNTNEIYYKEPAPMGIADYGIGPNGPHEYKTTSFLGIININSLKTFNKTLNNTYFGCRYGMSFQLNVNFQFRNNKSLYVYWAQDVLFLNTSDNNILFIDNVWNLSSANGNMMNSTISGSGTVSNSSGRYFYYDVSSQSMPGNCIDLKYPSKIYLMINATLKNGRPEIIFMYNDGYGWIAFDSPVFTFADNLTSKPEFVVNGNKYEPDGYSFYDAELILGGPAGGSIVKDLRSNVTLSLEYFNNHNYQGVLNAYNYGSDTAEGICNVTDNAYYYTKNGTIFASLKNGSGDLACIYSEADIGIVNISVPGISSGFIAINNSRIHFINGAANITIGPGNYLFNVYSSNGTLIASGVETVKPGEYINITPEYKIEIIEKGLPKNTKWYIKINNGKLFSSYNNTICFYEPNGNYSYNAISLNKNYIDVTNNSYFIVNNSNVKVNIYFKYLYSVTFTEQGLNNNIWYVNLTNGESFSTKNNTIKFFETNGTYHYEISNVTGYKLLISNGLIYVNGSDVSIYIYYNKEYKIEISETGLPVNTCWYLNGTKNYSSKSYILIEEPNGTYKFNVSSQNKDFHPEKTTLIINVNGSDLYYKIVFLKTLYIINFQSNLKTWNLFLNGKLSEHVLELTNGTYNYKAVSRNYKYVYGSFTVNGSNKNISITFIIQKYQISFMEIGLLNGTCWSLYINNTLYKSNSSFIIIEMPNGTYNYKINNVSGYVTKDHGIINVSGSNVYKNISYKKIKTYNFYYYTIIALIMVIAVIIIFSKRRNK